MKDLLISIYIFLYISHIILGPYWYRFILKKEDMKLKSKNLKEVAQKMFFITYVSFLFTIYFFINPTTETFILALLMTIFSLIFYVLVYHDSEYFKASTIDHSIIILPFIFYYKYFKIDLTKYKATNNTVFTILVLFIYALGYKKLYKIN